MQNIDELLSTFIIYICDLKDTIQNDVIKYCKDLETVLTDENSSNINALDLADERVAVLALLNKKECPIEILKLISNLDFAPNLGIVLRILLTFPISAVRVLVPLNSRRVQRLKILRLSWGESLFACFKWAAFGQLSHLQTQRVSKNGSNFIGGII
ncbi:hypothetical protein TNCV_3294731 [Trichonephila clavipes]|nr:hypothetical protein TNCV_3294731 [Trichonephila clavipes]